MTGEILKSEGRRGHAGAFAVDLLFLGLVAFFAVFFATHQGIGLLPVSANFLGPHVTESTQTLLHPLYKLLIASLGDRLSTVDQPLRFIHAFLFAAATIAIAFAGRNWGRSRFLGVIAGFLFLSSPDAIFVFSVAQSEALFCVLAFIALASFPSLIRSQTVSCWAVHGFLVSLALFTAWPGMMLALAVMMALAFLPKAPNPTKRPVLAWWVSAVGPWLFWVAVNGIPSQWDLAITFKPLSERDGFALMHLGLHWVVPPLGPGPLRTLLFFAFCFWMSLGIYGTYKRGFRLADLRKGIASPHASVWVWFGCFFIAAIFFRRFFLDASQPLDGKALLLFYPLIILGFVSLLEFFFRRLSEEKIFLSATIGLGVVLAVLFIFSMNTAVRKLYQTGIGYASLSWKQSPLANAVTTGASPGPFYSNAADFLAIRHGIKADYLPAKINPKDQLENSQFDLEVMSFKEKIRAQNARVIFFHAVYWRRYMVHLEDLVGRFGFAVESTFPDGVILK